MRVVKVIEIISQSSKSLKEAILKGFDRDKKLSRVLILGIEISG